MLVLPSRIRSSKAAHRPDCRRRGRSVWTVSTVAAQAMAADRASAGKGAGELPDLFGESYLRQRSRLSLAYGTPALALLIVGILVWAPVAPVSANEVLRKAMVADKARQSITLQQVVRQRVRIRKTGAGAGPRTAALDSWKSAKSTYWNSGADPLNTELLARYRANGLSLRTSSVSGSGRVLGQDSRFGTERFVRRPARRCPGIGQSRRTGAWAEGGQLPRPNRKLAHGRDDAFLRGCYFSNQRRGVFDSGPA